MRVLFVCTGNTCRSSMAEAIAAHKTDWEVRSAGVVAMAGDPASHNAMLVMEAKGIDLSSHEAAQVDEDLLNWADLILTMTRQHANVLTSRFPACSAKVHTLLGYAGAHENENVEDPFGGDIAAYESTAEAIETAILRIYGTQKEEQRMRTGKARLAVGCDHAGVELKRDILAFVADLGYEACDMGCEGAASVDYPDYARIVATAVAAGEYDLGILICGTGIGMSMAANKVKGVRAALCGDTFSARASREHNDANVLCLGQRVVGPGLVLDIVATWLGSAHLGGRHARRVEKIMALETGGEER